MRCEKSIKLLALSVLVLGAATARADDEDALAKAPPAVQETVKKILGTGKLAGVETEDFQGKPAYDIDLSIGGGDYAILVSPQGEILQREVEVNPALVPPEVMQAGTKAHPDGKTNEISIITRGSSMFYELEIKVDKDLHDVEISAGGKVLTDTVAAPEAAEPPAKDTKDEKGGEKKKD